MRRQVRHVIRPVVLVAAALVPSALMAQSVVRITAAGGRQADPEGGMAVAFTQDDRFALVLGNAGYPSALSWSDGSAWLDLWTGQFSHVLWALDGGPPNSTAQLAVLSANDRYLLIESWASNLVTGDTNDAIDVFLVDRQSNTIERVGLGSNGLEPNDHTWIGAVSDSGRFIAFVSAAANLGTVDANQPQLYRRDRSLDVTALISHNASGALANAGVIDSAMTSDGRWVAFTSYATNLVAGDTNGNADLFVYDALADAVTRASVNASGFEANYGVGPNFDMSADGRWIAFDSPSSNLVPGVVNLVQQVYLLDRSSGAIQLVSASSSGQACGDSAQNAQVSSDGRFVLFDSFASDIDPRDVDGLQDAFLRDMSSGTTQMVSLSSAGDPGVPSAPGGGSASSNALSSDGRLASFYADLIGLVPGVTSPWDGYLFDRLSSCAPIEGYCTPKLNSWGCEPRITCGGEPYTSGPTNAFFVSAHAVRPNTAGALIWSLAPAATAFGGGTLCVAPPLVHTRVQDSSANGMSWQTCSGSYSFFMSHAYMAAHGIGPGTSVYAQYWSRDPEFAFPNNVGLTDALHFTASP